MGGPERPRWPRGPSLLTCTSAAGQPNSIVRCLPEPAGSRFGFLRTVSGLGPPGACYALHCACSFCSCLVQLARARPSEHCWRPQGMHDWGLSFCLTGTVFGDDLCDETFSSQFDTLGGRWIAVTQ